VVYFAPESRNRRTKYNYKNQQMHVQIIIRNVNSYVLQRRGAIFRESKVQRRASNNSKLLVLQ